MSAKSVDNSKVFTQMPQAMSLTDTTLVSDNLQSDYDGLHNNSNDSTTGRSRYGRKIKPKSPQNNVNKFQQVRCISRLSR